MIKTQLTRCDLNQADFSGTGLKALDLSTCDFDELRLTANDLRGCHLNTEQAAYFAQQLLGVQLA